MALNKGVALNWKEEREDAGMFDAFLTCFSMFELLVFVDSLFYFEIIFSAA